jgi:hypothetical protein
MMIGFQNGCFRIRLSSAKETNDTSKRVSSWFEQAAFHLFSQFVLLMRLLFKS